MKDFTTVSVPNKTYYKLHRLKAKYKVKTFQQVLEILIKIERGERK